MKIAVIGSRSILTADLDTYISDDDEIVSGGAVGIDSCAAEYAEKNGISLKVFIPEYEKYGRGAPIVRNKQIVDIHPERLGITGIQRVLGVDER